MSLINQFLTEIEPQANDSNLVQCVKAGIKHINNLIMTGRKQKKLKAQELFAKLKGSSDPNHLKTNLNVITKILVQDGEDQHRDNWSLILTSEPRVARINWVNLKFRRLVKYQLDCYSQFKTSLNSNEAEKNLFASQLSFCNEQAIRLIDKHLMTKATYSEELTELEKLKKKFQEQITECRKFIPSNKFVVDKVRQDQQDKVLLAISNEHVIWNKYKHTLDTNQSKRLKELKQAWVEHQTVVHLRTEELIKLSAAIETFKQMLIANSLQQTLIFSEVSELEKQISASFFYRLQLIAIKGHDDLVYEITQSLHDACFPGKSSYLPRFLPQRAVNGAIYNQSGFLDLNMEEFINPLDNKYILSQNETILDYAKNYVLRRGTTIQQEQLKEFNLQPPETTPKNRGPIHKPIPSTPKPTTKTFNAWQRINQKMGELDDLLSITEIDFPTVSETVVVFEHICNQLHGFMPPSNCLDQEIQLTKQTMPWAINLFRRRERHELQKYLSKLTLIKHQQKLKINKILQFIINLLPEALQNSCTPKDLRMIFNIVKSSQLKTTSEFLQKSNLVIPYLKSLFNIKINTFTVSNDTENTNQALFNLYTRFHEYNQQFSSNSNQQLIIKQLTKVFLYFCPEKSNRQFAAEFFPTEQCPSKVDSVNFLKLLKQIRKSLSSYKENDQLLNQLFQHLLNHYNPVFDVTNHGETFLKVFFKDNTEKLSELHHKKTLALESVKNFAEIIFQQTSLIQNPVLNDYSLQQFANYHLKYIQDQCKKGSEPALNIYTYIKKIAKSYIEETYDGKNSHYAAIILKCFINEPGVIKLYIEKRLAAWLLQTNETLDKHDVLLFSQFNSLEFNFYFETILREKDWSPKVQILIEQFGSKLLQQNCLVSWFKKFILSDTGRINPMVHPKEKQNYNLLEKLINKKNGLSSLFGTNNLNAITVIPIIIYYFEEIFFEDQESTPTILINIFSNPLLDLPQDLKVYHQDLESFVFVKKVIIELQKKNISGACSLIENFFEQTGRLLDGKLKDFRLNLFFIKIAQAIQKTFPAVATPENASRIRKIIHLFPAGVVKEDLNHTLKFFPANHRELLHEFPDEINLKVLYLSQNKDGRIRTAYDFNEKIMTTKDIYYLNALRSAQKFMKLDKIYSSNTQYTEEASNALQVVGNFQTLQQFKKALMHFKPDDLQTYAGLADLYVQLKEIYWENFSGVDQTNYWLELLDPLTEFSCKYLQHLSISLKEKDLDPEAFKLKNTIYKISCMAIERLGSPKQIKYLQFNQEILLGRYLACASKVDLTKDTQHFSYNLEGFKLVEEVLAVAASSNTQSKVVHQAATLRAAIHAKYSLSEIKNWQDHCINQFTAKQFCYLEVQDYLFLLETYLEKLSGPVNLDYLQQVQQVKASIFYTHADLSKKLVPLVLEKIPVSESLKTKLHELLILVHNTEFDRFQGESKQEPAQQLIRAQELQLVAEYNQLSGTYPINQPLPKDFIQKLAAVFQQAQKQNIDLDSFNIQIHEVLSLSLRNWFDENLGWARLKQIVTSEVIQYLPRSSQQIISCLMDSHVLFEKLLELGATSKFDDNTICPETFILVPEAYSRLKHEIDQLKNHSTKNDMKAKICFLEKILEKVKILNLGTLEQLPTSNPALICFRLAQASYEYVDYRNLTISPRKDYYRVTLKQKVGEAGLFKEQKTISTTKDVYSYIRDKKTKMVKLQVTKNRDLTVPIINTMQVKKAPNKTLLFDLKTDPQLAEILNGYSSNKLGPCLVV